MNINAFRKQIYEWLQLNVIGKKIYNYSIKAYIIINKRGIKHAVSFSNKNYVQKLKSMYHLIELLKNAVFSHTQPDNRNRKTIKEIIILSNTTTIEDTVYNVEVIVRHTNEGKFYYDHVLINN